MKYLRLNNVIAIALIAVALAGCAGSPKKVAFDTISSLDVSTTKAYQAYLDLVATEKLPIASMREVGVAFDSFKATESTAITVAQSDTSVLAPPNLIQAANTVLNVINKVKELK